MESTTNQHDDLEAQLRSLEAMKESPAPARAADSSFLETFSQAEQPAQPSVEPGASEAQHARGRFAFAVQMTPSGLVVRPVFVNEDNHQVLSAEVAVFPNLEYALAQLEQAKLLAAQQYELAARAGAGALAQQTAVHSPSGYGTP